MTIYWFVRDSVSIQAFVSNSDTLPSGVPTGSEAATGIAVKFGRDDMGDGGPHETSSNSVGDDELEAPSALFGRRALIQMFIPNVCRAALSPARQLSH